jgi:hypothetical protein
MTREALMATLFDMAVDHFWQATQAGITGDQLNCVVQMANGLQQFCAGVQTSTGSSDPLFQMAISHFWQAQQSGISGNQPDCLTQMASGLQQFCAAVGARS